MLLGKHIVKGISGPSIPIGEKWTFTSNGSWEAPANGKYKITLVGAGGKGGSGCKRRLELDFIDSHGKKHCYVCASAGIASGGGGGAGQTVIQTHTLRKDATLIITIGQPNSNPSKVTGVVSITANGGDTGGSAYSSNDSCRDKVYAGSVAANYGTGGGAGYVSNRADHSPGGGAGKVSNYGNGYGQGGQGGYGEWNKGPFHTGYNGTAGICVIEYMER